MSNKKTRTKVTAGGRGEKPATVKSDSKAGHFRFVMGIDTGVNTGYAYFDRVTGQLSRVGSCLIHRLIMELHDDYRSGYAESVFIRVEDARLATFGRTGKADMYKAQGAGSVKRDAKILEDFLTEYGFHFEMVRPAMRKKKITAAEFQKITGWTERTNQHARDAAMLCFKY